MILPAVLLLLGPGADPAAFALAATVEIQSLQILPVETTAGKHPQIIGTIKATAPGETMEVNVIASVTRPDNVVKSWMWKNIRIKDGETKTFSISKEYEVKLNGTYKVDFSVYSKDMRPLNRLSKSFAVVEPSHPPVKPASQEGIKGTAGSISGKALVRPPDDRHVGVGVYANTLNLAGGATMLLWPSKYAGLQGSYTMGQFTTAEGRLLARLPLSSGFNPYAGVGYASVSTERTVDVIGAKTTFKNNGMSGVMGVEIPIRKSVFGYVEISGAAINLKKEVTSGGQTGTATVKYSPLTIGFSVVYFVF